MELLKRARISSGFTLKEVAERTGLSSLTIHKAENGISKPSYDNVMLLMQCYGKVPIWVPDKAPEGDADVSDAERVGNALNVSGNQAVTIISQKVLDNTDNGVIFELLLRLTGK